MDIENILSYSISYLDIFLIVSQWDNTHNNKEKI